jgi:hypothetical protein
MAFLENPDGIMEGESGPNVSDGAVFANRYPYLFGNRLGVLISASSATYNAPIQLLLS